MGLDICGDDSIYLPASGSCDECGQFEQRLTAVEDEMPNKQDKLTAGTNITIDANNVISATGGGGGGDSYWQVNSTSSDLIEPVSGYDGVITGNTTVGAVLYDDGLNVFNGGEILQVRSNHIKGLRAPTVNDEAANKKYVDDQIADVTLTATTPIVKTGTVLSHADSGVTAGSKGDTTNQTPAFGGTFKALSETVDAKGHVTALAEHTVKIPDTKASTTADGLMSKEDKATLDDIPNTYQETISVTTPITKTGNTIAHADSGVTAGSKGDTANQTPTWGGTFKAVSGTVNAKGHLTAFADHTVTIPNAKATTTADGLMSKEDKATVDGLATTYQPKLTAGTGISIDSTTNTISATGVSVTVSSPITLSGSTIGHADSGATAGSKGDTSAQTPAFGGTFKAVSATVNATGHITALNDHNVTIPNTKASSSADGLMSKEDKATFDAIPTTYQPTISVTSPITKSGNTIAHADSGVTAGSKGDTTAQTPTWGGTFKALSGTVDAKGHVTAFAEHTVTIPNAKATTSADGLMSKEDKATFDAIPTTYQQKLTAGDNITITGNTIAADEYTGSDYIDIDANKVVSITNMDDLIVQSRYTSNQTMAAGAEREIAFPVSVPAGYKTLGVAAAVIGAYSCSAARITESTFRVKNYGSSSVTFTAVLRVNYIKEDFTTIAS